VGIIKIPYNYDDDDNDEDDDKYDVSAYYLLLVNNSKAIDRQTHSNKQSHVEKERKQRGTL